MGITVLGQDSDVGSPDLENATAIGFRATVMSSNTIQLGNDNVQRISTFAPIQVGEILLPNFDGINGQVLTTNGDGSLFWSTPKNESDEVIESLRAEIEALRQEFDRLSFEYSDIMAQIDNRLANAGIPDWSDPYIDFYENCEESGDSPCTMTDEENPEAAGP